MKYLAVWTRVVEADSKTDARNEAKSGAMRVATVPVLGPPGGVPLAEWAPFAVVLLMDEEPS